MRPLASIADGLLAQRGHLFVWVPVCLGVGVGIYFGLRAEPDWRIWMGLGLLAALCIGAARLAGPAFAPLPLGLMLVSAGVGLAGLRAHLLAAPVLSYRYYGAIEGRIIAIDRSASDAVRLTLDQVVLDHVPPARTPLKVRVSLHGAQDWLDPAPGQVVGLTGHLSPPAGPVEPGGFDYRRTAWFDRIGAVGYTRSPAVLLRPPAGGVDLWLFRQRLAVSKAVASTLPGQVGAFAAALMTGDRAGLSQQVLTDMRAANLAHLLAISGLHMGLLTAFVFGVVRAGLALIRPLALRWPVKKIAAVVALLTGAAYLALSGASVATERAFVMVAVALVAVLLDRRALTLRAVAMAATIILVLRPEALVGPGFQMSFAATTALVAGFGLLSGRELRLVPRWAAPVITVIASSLIAGLATAPFAAAHFNQVSHYGLIANLAAVPLMGVWVMPAGVLAACLAPFGLGWVGLRIMAPGLAWILGVAHEVARWPGALGHVVTPAGPVLALLSLGFLWLILWRGRPRWAGFVPMLLAAVLWGFSTRPALLVADSGAMMGAMTADGRVLSKPRGDSFSALAWLENDGAPVPQDVAAGRAGLTRDGRVIRAALPGGTVLLVTGKVALAALDGCGGAAVLISNQVDAGPRPCIVYDLSRLRRTGALAIDASTPLRIVTASEVTGHRPWSP
ncbi:ComEC/Rec2 family competence protein [Limimaricola sp.]|uniref:ComEC/Rec2 family competence protein n=1 Tax=Limimaricola sp. TaxID=2211665 RepID=UPI0025BAFB7E|nr:ComEC/Rec2 family competence protein [Limimaricola sp.]